MLGIPMLLYCEEYWTRVRWKFPYEVEMKRFEIFLMVGNQYLLVYTLNKQLMFYLSGIFSLQKQQIAKLVFVNSYFECIYVPLSEFTILNNFEIW